MSENKSFGNFIKTGKKEDPSQKNFFHRQRIPSPVPPTQIHFFIKKKLTFFLANQKKTYICRLKD